jgi:hypothetical protein
MKDLPKPPESIQKRFRPIQKAIHIPGKNLQRGEDTSPPRFPVFQTHDFWDKKSALPPHFKAHIKIAVELYGSLRCSTLEGLIVSRCVCCHELIG